MLTIIKQINGKNSIYNGAGIQLEGSSAPDLNGGLSPKELLEASLGLCIAISMQKMFDRDDVTVEDHDISIEVSANKGEANTNRFEKLDVSIQFPDHFSAKYKKKLLVSVERACTIGNTLRNSVTIETVEQAK